MKNENESNRLTFSNRKLRISTADASTAVCNAVFPRCFSLQIISAPLFIKSLAPSVLLTVTAKWNGVKSSFQVKLFSYQP